MRSYIRYSRAPKRQIPPSRYPLYRAKIGYLYRTAGQILSYAYPLSDPACRDGEMLRLPPQSFSEIYYSRMMRHIHNDADQEATAVYFDPYTGRFLVIGSKQLYLDGAAHFGTAGNVLYLEGETPFRFDAEAYGAYYDPDAMQLTLSDYFVPDVTGTTVAACMTDPRWDGRTAPRACVMQFFDRYFDALFPKCGEAGPDTLTTILAMAVRSGNHVLLTRLLTLMPQLGTRFRPTLREEAKLVGFTVPSPDGTHDAPVVSNLFSYAMLLGDPDTMQTLIRLYERPGELSELLHHPMYYHLGFYHVRRRNPGALSVLLSHGYSPDSIDSEAGRLPLLSEAVLSGQPFTVSMLIARGADPEKRDRSGKTPVDLAAEGNVADCLGELLCAYDKNPEKGREVVLSLADRIPMDDDNQALMCILERYMK